MVFTAQVFTLLQNQGAFQICQGGTKVPCIDAAVSVRFAAGKLCAVCAFPAAFALAQWVNYAINYEHMVFHTAVARIWYAKLSRERHGSVAGSARVAEGREAPDPAYAVAELR